jgi:mannose-1-phosphate guanylyltransferase/mannose-6-phosphate isomerase
METGFYNFHARFRLKYPGFRQEHIMLIPVVLAGGSGTRLWPLSRSRHPKQLLCLTDDQTLLQHTLLRLSGLADLGPPIVLCNDEHRFMVAEQLRTIGLSEADIVLEPVGRNTAPAIAVAAMRAARNEADSLLLVLPADHAIEDSAMFQRAVVTGGRFARKGFLITFGVVPDTPETGYGYIKKGRRVSRPDETVSMEAVAIEKFVEKPDLNTAETYVASGDYCWNSGMFMFSANRVLEELQRFVPDIVSACRRAVDAGESDLDFFRLEADAFRACPSDSIDYAVMERTRHGVMVPFQAGWNDLGSWEALYRTASKDSDGNVVRGDAMLHQTRDCYIHATDRMVAAAHIDNLIVVETADAVLIVTRPHAQAVKHLVDRLVVHRRPEALTHRKIFRPWGSSELLEQQSDFEIKRIRVRPGAHVSLQKHARRVEHWVVLRGTATVTKDGAHFDLYPNESVFIPAGVMHGLENRRETDLDLIEVRSGEWISEDDVERFPPPEG